MYAKDYIKVPDLIVGARYRVIARNFDEATWDGIVFKGMRHKFGKTFEDTELHYDACEHYGTCQPIELLEDL